MKRVAFSSLIVGALVGTIVNIIVSGNAIPAANNTEAWFTLVTATWFLPMYILYILFAYLFPLIGFTYIGFYYKDKSTSKYAVLLSILGTVTVLPTMGVIAYTSTIVSNANQEIMIELIQEAVLHNSMFLNLFGAISYTIGTSLFGYLLLQDKKRIPGISFILHGLLLSFGFGFYPMLLLGWLLLIPISIVIIKP